MNYRRLVLGTILGAVSGLICVLGMIGFRTVPAYLAPPYDLLFLVGGFYNRVFMGFIIGLAADFKIYKEADNVINSLIRGAIIGALSSVGTGFFGQSILLSFFLMGIGYGILSDALTTWITKEK